MEENYEKENKNIKSQQKDQQGKLKKGKGPQ